MRGYISEVFYNLNEILVYHRQMLDRLFELQKDQHPLITDFASIVLDSESLVRPRIKTLIYVCLQQA